MVSELQSVARIVHFISISLESQILPMLVTYSYTRHGLSTAADGVRSNKYGDTTIEAESMPPTVNIVAV